MFDKNTINEFKRNTLKQTAELYAQAGKQASEEIRDQIVRNWFREYNGESMIAATIHKPIIRVYSENRAQVSVLSYIDPSLLFYGSASQWSKYHETDMDSSLYVLDLQLNQGIIGLPARGTKPVNHDKLWGPHHLDENRIWINDNFIQRPPLLGVLETSVLWSQWESSVKSKINK